LGGRQGGAPVFLFLWLRSIAGLSRFHKPACRIHFFTETPLAQKGSLGDISHRSAAWGGSDFVRGARDDVDYRRPGSQLDPGNQTPTNYLRPGFVERWFSFAVG